MSSPWEKARSLLSVEDQKLFDFDKSDRKDVLLKIVDAVQSQKDRIVKEQLTVKGIGGRKLVIRELCAKIVASVQNYMRVVDTVVQYDPVHSALPWAGIRFFIQLSINDVKTFYAMIEGLEKVSSVMARYVFLEIIYLQGSSALQDRLKEDIVKLYAAVLRYLCKLRKYYSYGSTKRLAVATFHPPDLDQALIEILDEEKTVRSVASLIEAQRQQDNTQQTSQILANTGSALIGINQMQVTQANLEVGLSSLQTQFTRTVDQVLTLQDNLNGIIVSRSNRRILTGKDARTTQTLRWLSDIPYRRHHETARSDIIPDSGQWLLTDARYIDWKESSASQILWLHGIHGCGKTKLVTTVIETMQAERKNTPNAAPFAYFYCARDTAEIQRSNPCEVLRAIVKQLSSCHAGDPLLKPVADKYRAKKSEAEQDGSEPSRLTTQECEKLILELAVSTPVTIIIDALDECDPTRRYLVLDALQKLLSNSPTVVKVLVSSRDDEDLANVLGRYDDIEVTADNNSDDISRFVDTELQHAISHKRLLGGNVVPDLTRDIGCTLVDGSHGMFRWVSLSLENLCDPERMRTEHDVKKALGRLPKNLTGSYESIYTRILGFADTSRYVAETTLQWLMYARRPLAVQEMLAVVSRASDGVLLQLSVANILGLCCNLVVLDKVQSVLRLSHLSVREYLELRPEYAEGRSQFAITQTCLTTLLRGKESQDALLDYATYHWPAHYEYIDYCDREITLISDFLFGEEHLEDWLEAVGGLPRQLSWNSDLDRKIQAASSTPPSPLFVISCFGLVDVLRVTNNADRIPNWDQRNSDGASAIYLAARWGHFELVKFLLDHGVNIDASGGQLGSALQASAYAGHEDIARLLLSAGARSSSQGEFSEPVHAAMIGGHEMISRILLQDGIQFRNQSEFDTCMTFAEFGGHVLVIELLLAKFQGSFAPTVDDNLLQRALYERKKRRVNELLETFLDLNEQTGLFGNALQAAIFGGKIPLVKLLIEKGARLDMNGRFGSPLRAAIIAGHDDIAEWLLVDKEADLAVEDNKLGDCLQAAAWKGNISMMSLLLKYNANVSGSGGFFRNALQAASFAGHDHAVCLLLKEQADLNERGRFRDALQAAVHGSKEKTVQLLIDKAGRLNPGGWVLNPFGSGESFLCSSVPKHTMPFYNPGISERVYPVGPLEVAACIGNVQLIQLLISRGAIIDAGSRDETYLYTALQIAAFRGHEEAVCLLLTKGADVNAVRSVFGTALEAALEGSNYHIARLILGNGAGINLHRGWLGSCLQIFSERGDIDAVRFLLDQGADIEDRGGLGCPLQLAAFHGHEAVVTLLLDHGADPLAEHEFPEIRAMSRYWLGTRHTGNSLHAASAGGHTSVCKILLGKDLHRYMSPDTLTPAIETAITAGHSGVVTLLLDAAGGSGIGARATDTVLVEACKGIDTHMVQLMIDRGGNVNARDKENRSALHEAAKRGLLPTVKILIRNGADLEATSLENCFIWDRYREDTDPKYRSYERNEEDLTPLSAAFLAFNIPYASLTDIGAVRGTIKMLTEAGADIGQIQRHKIEILKNCGVELLKMFQQKGLNAVPKIGTKAHIQAVTYAAQQNDLDMAHFLLIAQPAEEYYPFPYSAAFSTALKQINAVEKSEGQNLTTSAAGDRSEVMALLLQHHEHRKDHVLQALEESVVRGSLATIKMLLQYTNDRGFPVSFDDLVLRAIKRHDAAHVVEYLLDSGADCNMTDSEGQTLLYLCAASTGSLLGAMDTVKLLIRYGTPINNAGGVLGTALHAALANGCSSDFVKFLVGAGADVNAGAGTYGTPLQAAMTVGHPGPYAREYWQTGGYTAAALVLLDHGAEIDTQGGYYGTALQAAAHVGNTTGVRLLLQRGADVNALGGEFGSPLMAARASRDWSNKQIEKILLDAGAVDDDTR